MTEESAVKVCVRVRPLIAREESAALDDSQPVQLFWKADQKCIHQIDDGNSTKSFSFDRVFTSQETTNQLYQNIAKPLVVSTVEGYNGTIFAYGQTASGKTFTMMGSEHIPGVIPLAVEDVFQTIKNFPKKEFLLRVSYMEIYNETVSDLLVDSWKRKPLEVRETINKNTYVADLTEELVTSSAQALAWIRKGEKNRRYGMTKMNQRSSRSHTIFRMILESRERSDPLTGENGDGAIIVSHLNLVDLAGSERASQTGAEGTRFKEGCNINRSLFTLGQVIKKVTDEGQKGFTNYRDSKLTRILQNSLGGNAKTVIICTITPMALDETLSTLQFASTAKKMKNDPHVTEVSDDGALLKRYRNEIEDLKRRLMEVSSVTQTTDTEKKVLAQLLQEKDQLQRDQEDRIRNLTRLLVTSSNLVPGKRMPKRRVTWGGKMLRLAHLSIPETSEHSFSEHSAEKWKDFNSCLIELPEDDMTIDNHWNPDETSEEMDQSSVQSFEHGPDETSERIRDLLQKISQLELQLESESQQKEEATDKVANLDVRVAELQLQLRTEIQQKDEALEKVENSEKRAAELELLQQTEAQQKSEAKEMIQMLNLKVADQETQLGEHCYCQNENKQIRKDFEETIHLCETLAAEKSIAVSERDDLREELRMVMERTERLEKEKSALSQDLQDKRETKEFESLEEEIRKEQENEMKNEILTLKNALKSSEVEQQMLLNKLKILSDELNKAREFSDGLQRKMASQTAEDPECVSTEKEIALSEQDSAALSTFSPKTAEKDRMQSMITSLTAEKDQLQCTVTFVTLEKDQLSSTLTSVTAENDQLQSTLASVTEEKDQLQSTLTSVTEEKVQLQSTLNSVTEENDQLQSTLTSVTEEKDQLQSTLTSVTEEKDQLQSTLTSVTEEKDQLQSTLTSVTAEKDQLRSTLTSLTGEKEDLNSVSGSVIDERHQLQFASTGVTTDLDKVNSDLTPVTVDGDDLNTAIKSVIAERDQLKSLLTSVTAESHRLQSVITSLTGETNQLQSTLASVITEKDHLQSTLTSVTSERDESRRSLQQHMETLFECIQGENKPLPLPVSSSNDMEKILSSVASVCAERDQLKMDLQENVEMMIENQEELRTALEKIRAQKEIIKQLKAADTAGEDSCTQLESLQKRIQSATEELDAVRKEKDRLLSEKTGESLMISAQSEELQTLSKEKEKLQEKLYALRLETKQLKAELGDRMETFQGETSKIKDLLKALHEELQAQKRRNVDLQRVSKDMENSLDQQIRMLTCKVESIVTEKDALLSKGKEDLRSITVERDSLQEKVHTLREEKQQLVVELEDKMETLHREVETVKEKLRLAETEKNDLLSKQEASRTASADNETLRCKVTALTGERDQLQLTLDALRQEHQRLSAELMEKIDAISAIEENRQQRTEGGQELVLQQELPLKASNTGLAHREQPRLDDIITTVRQTGSSWLHNSTEQLQECFGQLQKFIDTCSKIINTPIMEESLDEMQFSLSESREIYAPVYHSGVQHFETLEKIFVHLRVQAQDYKKLFEELVNTDLAVFEERLLQRVLLCRSRADNVSLGEEDFHILCRDRLNELLVKRQLYQQKITWISDKLWSTIAFYPKEMSEEIAQRETFVERMLTALNRKPTKGDVINSFLKTEQERRTAAAQSKRKTLQEISEEQNCATEEMKQLAQTYLELKEERSKSSALVQALNKAPLQPEVSLQKENPELHPTEENLQAKNTLQTRENKQQDHEESSTSADELKALQAKVFKMEAKWNSAANKHQQEIHRLNSLLKAKEESLRTLKEMMRLQQCDMVPQGEAVYNKLTNPKGLAIKSSVLLDKAKLEEEVKHLQGKITELESLVGTLQAEISKWKNRAIKLKGKPLSPSTPTKRGLPVTSDSSSRPCKSKNLLVTPKTILDSPRKVLESPSRVLETKNTYLLDFPKSKFFDMDNSYDLLSTTYPKQFFDNSGLGTIPDLEAPTRERSCSSPKYDDMCKTQ